MTDNPYKHSSKYGPEKGSRDDSFFFLSFLKNKNPNAIKPARKITKIKPSRKEKQETEDKKPYYTLNQQ